MDLTTFSTFSSCQGDGDLQFLLYASYIDKGTLGCPPRVERMSKQWHDFLRYMHADPTITHDLQFTLAGGAAAGVCHLCGMSGSALRVGYRIELVRANEYLPTTFASCRWSMAFCIEQLDCLNEVWRR
jgi:hypothetical protein